MPLSEYFNNLKRQVKTQSLPGSYKKRVTSKTMALFLVIGIANIALGIILFIPYSKIFSTTIPYENGINELNFTLPVFVPKLFIYLQMNDFYQSYGKYAKSYNIKQLRGKPVTKLKSCNPLATENGAIIYPCGLIANTFNQDTFTLTKDGNEIEILTDDISWSSAKNRVKNTQYRLDQIVAPPLWQPYTELPQLETNYRFVNWMSLAIFPKFRKLYGIAENLEPGKYKMIVDSDYPYGRTGVALTTSSWAGGKNYFLPVMMIIIGTFMLSSSFSIWNQRDTLN